MIVLDMPQRSPEWFKARAGMLTGSNAGTAMLKDLKSGGEPAAKRDLRFQLALERTLGTAIDTGGFTNADMKRGIEREPAARASYEIKRETLVTEVGFCVSEFHDHIGCSPDGLVYLGDEVGLIEIKCPRPAIHWETLRSKDVPSSYIYQLAHNMLVTDANWCDFVSYCEEFPIGHQLVIVRKYRADLPLSTYNRGQKAFMEQVTILHEEMRNEFGSIGR